MEIDDTLIIKFLNGSCDTDELRAVKEWLDADPAHAEALFRLESVHRRVAAASMNAREVSQHLRNVHRRIDAENRKTHREVILRTWLRRAAVIVGIVFVGAMAYWLAGADSPLRGPEIGSPAPTVPCVVLRCSSPPLRATIPAWCACPTARRYG